MRSGPRNQASHRRALLGTGIGVLLTIGSAGCHDPAGATGSFVEAPASTLGFVELPPGTRMGLLIVLLRNDGADPLQLRGAELVGDGVGEVVRQDSAEVAPWGDGVRAVPGGSYLTDPPVYYAGGERCHSPEIVPLDGYVVAPGQTVRVWQIVRLLEPGAYSVLGLSVTYADGDDVREQTIPIGFEGDVVPGAPAPKPDRTTEKPCLDRTTVL